MIFRTHSTVALHVTEGGGNWVAPLRPWVGLSLERGGGARHMTHVQFSKADARVCNPRLGNHALPDTQHLFRLARAQERESSRAVLSLSLSLSPPPVVSPSLSPAPNTHCVYIHHKSFPVLTVSSIGCNHQKKIFALQTTLA